MFDKRWNTSHDDKGELIICEGNHDRHESCQYRPATKAEKMWFKQRNLKQSGWIESVKQELKLAREKWPHWPIDPIHASAIVAEEAGELVKAAHDYTYDNNHVFDLVEMRNEAVQTAAMAIRFLQNLDMYMSRPCMKEESK